MKPLFPYIGGKSWLKEELENSFENVLKNTSSKIDSYCEPFVGGLGSFLSIYELLEKHNIKKVYLNDINVALYNLYTCIKNNDLSFVDELNEIYINYFNTIPKELFTIKNKNNKSITEIYLKDAIKIFYKQREIYNNTKNIASFLFIQQRCFNGIYRENMKGNYNSPYGYETRPNNFSYDDFIFKIKDIQNVFDKFELTITNNSFEQLDYNDHTLYYLDPPYMNNYTENRYTKNGFDHFLLLDKINHSNFIYSNHYNDLIIEKLNHKDLKTFIRKNTISTKNRENDKKEMLLINWL